MHSCSIGQTFREFVQIINSLSFINILKWFIDFHDPLSGLAVTLVNVTGNFSTAPEVGKYPVGNK